MPSRSALRGHLADASFDVVVAGETLAHMPYPSVFLGGIRRVLTTDGIFIGSVPNAYRYCNRIRVLQANPIDKDPTHLQLFSITARCARKTLRDRRNRTDTGEMVELLAVPLRLLFCLALSPMKLAECLANTKTPHLNSPRLTNVLKSAPHRR